MIVTFGWTKDFPLLTKIFVDLTKFFVIMSSWSEA
jgi:hypothetical protein